MNVPGNIRGFVFKTVVLIQTAAGPQRFYRQAGRHTPVLTIPARHAHLAVFSALKHRSARTQPNFELSGGDVQQTQNSVSLLQ